MTQPEAQWLRERMVENSRGTLLEHILLTDKPPVRRLFPGRTGNACPRRMRS